MTNYTLQPIGHVESALTDLATAPRQPDEQAPPATLVIDPSLADACANLRAGDEILVLTWLDRARRDVLRLHPRGDKTRPQEGVFSTRAPHRPNPIGLHRTRIARIDGTRIHVTALEALNGTPILDLKPVLSDNVADR